MGHPVVSLKTVAAVSIMYPSVVGAFRVHSGTCACASTARDVLL